jgi:glutamate synthase (NADPH/NADH)
MISSFSICALFAVKKVFFVPTPTILQAASGIIDGSSPGSTIDLAFPISNNQRTFGATLSHAIAKRYGEAGLPAGSNINIRLTGSAGQSFCAFLVAGVAVTLVGDANDYVGKCLSGGRIVVFPPENSGGGGGEFRSEANVIVGNVCLYGATSGTAFFRGVGAERFCVRNSGATAVIEGVGDHGCEYMTGGRVIILGPTGRNFAAGMSGGIAYVLDENKDAFSRRCNTSMVDLLPVETYSDLTFLQATLSDFVAATGSAVGGRLLADWPAAAAQFIKVFPHEYQRALQELAEEEAKVAAAAAAAAATNHYEAAMNGLAVRLGDGLDLLKSPNLDIRNAYAIDNTPSVFSQSHLILPAEKMEPPDSEDEDHPLTPPKIKGPPIKVLDMKKKSTTAMPMPPVIDIEDAIADADGAKKMKKREVLLDKTRGFVKYKREARSYRDAAERMKDWDEIYDFKHVRRGLKTQAARCMDCGVPFCHSVSHGCPLGNIIPKFNDLVFHSDWKEALNQLTQTNNFPEFTGRVCPAPCEGACVLGKEYITRVEDNPKQSLVLKVIGTRTF